MAEHKFKFKLKSKHDESHITVYINLLDYNTGLIKYPIDTNEWKILQCSAFTDLQDIEGTDIYEDDLIKDEYEREGTVYFNRGCYCVDLEGEQYALENVCSPIIILN